MIAIERSSNASVAVCFALFCREIILAALLIMCNAAENFFRVRFEFCERHKIFCRKIKFSSRTAHRATSGFAVEIISAVESPVATERVPCFASLTFDGG